MYGNDTNYLEFPEYQEIIIIIIHLYTPQDRSTNKDIGIQLSN